MRRFFVLALACVALSCSNEVDLGLDVAWPVAYSDEPDADPINAPFGYREQSDRLDFHAGIDINLDKGTKVRAILPGVVEKTEYDRDRRGPGKWVLIEHGDNVKTAYLHLSRFSVKAGDEVYAGQVVGRSGTTGTKSPHLHLTYMVGVDHSGGNEDFARNPLEVLPHGEMPEPIVTWEDDAVTLEIVIQPMVIQNIIVSGDGESRELDYADIVGQGNPDRDDEVQDGLSIELLEHDDRETFDLRLSPEGAFVPDSVVALDYTGEVVLDASR